MERNTYQSREHQRATQNAHSQERTVPPAAPHAHGNHWSSGSVARRFLEARPLPLVPIDSRNPEDSNIGKAQRHTLTNRVDFGSSNRKDTRLCFFALRCAGRSHYTPMRLPSVFESSSAGVRLVVCPRALPTQPSIYPIYGSVAATKHRKAAITASWFPAPSYSST